MCGIVGYLGYREAQPILLEGLRRLEYRGYDSAGIAILDDDGLSVFKEPGKVAELEKIVNNNETTATIGIGHTRWATHGVPNGANAHPHTSNNGIISVVHNGIIENYGILKEDLVNKGITFHSETDTEVLANLIAVIKQEENSSTFHAVAEALKLVRGAYAIAVLTTGEPDSLVIAKKSSPLAVGLGEGEFIIGSDATPIVSHTQKVIYLNDDEVAELHRGGHYDVISLEGVKVDSEIHELELSVDKLQKDGYADFMLKEIHEQPHVIRETMRGRLSLDQRTVLLGGIIDYEQRILRAPKITIAACGTSMHAGMVGKYLIEELAGIPVEVVPASEFRYRKAPLSDHDVVIAISQSGETADTLAAIELAKSHNALTLGIVNVVGSSIARATDAGIYTHAGPEISVASTKAFCAQVTALTLMALRFAQQLGTLPSDELQKRYQELSMLPQWAEETLKSESVVENFTKSMNTQRVVLFLARNNCYPVALEGALKLKEISYIPAEGYPAGEMKHGPIALISEGTAVIFIIPEDQTLREKILSNIQEVKARGAKIFAIGNNINSEFDDNFDDSVSLSNIPDLFLPVIAAIPLQFVAYHTAINLGLNVDKPRNLAKSVTVE